VRVGIDASILGPRTRDSGIGRYVRRLVERMPVEDPESEFVLFAPAGCPLPDHLPANVQRQPLPKLPLGKLSTPAAYLFALPRLARQWRLDVFHAPTVHPRPSWPPVPRMLPCPLVVTLHDVIPLTFYARGPSRLPRTHLAFYRWNLRAAVRASAVITVSAAEAEAIASTLGMPREAITVIHNGVDSAPICETPSPTTGHPYILFVGSYEARKNLVTATRAYAVASERGLAQDLVVVATSGSGPMEPVRAVMRESRIEGRVRIIDGRKLTDADLWRLYSAADVFIYPSLADSFGLPPLEAMAAGVPVVASRLPALREVLGDAAVFCDGTDTRAFADALLRLGADAGERRRLSGQGLVQARRYSWETCARQTLDVYRTVAGLEVRPLAGDGMVVSGGACRAI
jgi:glycosyltransferase involved in cell wall biosynthesis